MRAKKPWGWGWTCSLGYVARANYYLGGGGWHIVVTMEKSLQVYSRCGLRGGFPYCSRLRLLRNVCQLIMRLLYT